MNKSINKYVILTTLKYSNMILSELIKELLELEKNGNGSKKVDTIFTADQFIEIEAIIVKPDKIVLV